MAAEHGARNAVNRGFIAEECIHPRKPHQAHRVSEWSLVFGLETEQQLAMERARQLIRAYDHAKGARPLLIPQWARNVIYRVGITGLSQSRATTLCLELRHLDEHCIVLPPKTAQLTVERALATIDWIASQKIYQEQDHD